MGQNFSIFCNKKRTSPPSKVEREKAPILSQQKKKVDATSDEVRKQRPPCCSPRRPGQ